MICINGVIFFFDFSMCVDGLCKVDFYFVDFDFGDFRMLYFLFMWFIDIFYGVIMFLSRRDMIKVFKDYLVGDGFKSY